MSAGTATVGHASDTPPRDDLGRRRTWIAALAFGGAVAVMLAGWLLLFDAGTKVPVREATVGGLHMKMVDARWILDQMDHGENFQKPATMMPDMPEWGSQRVSLALSLENRTEQSRIFRGEEFTLQPDIGDAAPPVGAQVGRAVLQPGQTLNTALYFDFDARNPHGKLRVVWERDGESVYLPIPEPAEHVHLLPRGDAGALPGDARLLLPIGKPARGKQLYDAVFGCVACHGDIETPGTNNVGPHLAGIGASAASRVEGLPAAQYIYQSILEPNAFIAPDCKHGLPCEQPSAMPEYGTLVSLENVADLVTYLLEQQTVSGEPEQAAEEPEGQS